MQRQRRGAPGRGGRTLSRSRPWPTKRRCENRRRKNLKARKKQRVESRPAMPFHSETGGGRRWILLIAVGLAATFATAQEGMLQAEFRREGERVSDACKDFSFKVIPGCGYELFTDHPFHIAAGSMPPQNGFGLGAAFVWSENTQNWRLSWDLDAVGATSGAWRAGGYMTIVHTPHPKKNPIKVITPQPDASTPSQQPIPVPSKLSEDFTHPYTVYNVYAQSISLNKLFFFGLGNDSTLAEKSVFGR